MMLWVTKLKEPRESRMDVHKNARLTPHCRALLVDRVLKGVKRHLVAPSVRCLSGYSEQMVAAISG
jgi:hypothetical protein